MNPVALQQLAGIVGAGNVLTGDAALPHYREQRNRYASVPVPVVLPGDTAEVAAVVKLCCENGIGMVPQGGNTGLVGGSVATSPDQIILNLQKLDMVFDVDPIGFTLTAGAGCTLAQVQAAAQSANRLFPLGLSVGGTCRIGGTIATNAGGVNVLRYGNMRELVLGLEVVLPNGEIINELSALRKSNTGLDLKQLFIGSEGTLGIITAAVLRLFPISQQRAVGWAAYPDLDAAMDAFVRLREQAGEVLTAFEIMSAASVALVERFRPALRNPLPGQGTWYALVEVAATCQNNALLALLPGQVAGNEDDERHFWQIRREIPWVQREAGASLKHDISVPLSNIAKLVSEAERSGSETISGSIPIIFGHAGDGNLHYNILQPPSMDAAAFLGHRETMQRQIHDLVHKYGGSLSAEHGIGLAKKDELGRLWPATSLALKRRIKETLDPHNLMNPGKGLPDAS